MVLVPSSQVEGAATGSYGLNVARLAGVPDRVLALAARNAQWMRQQRSRNNVGSENRESATKESIDSLRCLDNSSEEENLSMQKRMRIT